MKRGMNEMGLGRRVQSLFKHRTTEKIDDFRWSQNSEH
jgi:hypothetical protein